MLVLQDCPICYEEFDERVRPHTIHYGHVFCSPCLAILSATSSAGKCPICRVVFRGHRVQPVLGALTDSESEEEKALWHSLKNITEVDYEARSLFVKEHSTDSMIGQKMSEYTRIAVDMLRFFVSTERENRKLKAKLRYTAQIQKKLVKANNILQDKVKEVELRMPAKSPRVRPLPRVPEPDATHSTLEKSKSPEIIREIQNPESSMHGCQAAHSRDTTNFNQNQGSCRYESCVPIEFNSKQMTRAAHTMFARQNLERDAHGNLIWYPTIAAAIRSYTSEGENELSLTVGEWLDLFPDTNLGPQQDWIWCGKQDGRVGYVPRRCLFVRSIVET